MPILAAQQVIELIATQVAEAASLGTGRVTTDRCWPVDEGELPWSRVLYHDEGVTTLSTSLPYTQQHKLQISVELLARAVSGMDAELAELHRQALAALFAPAAEAARKTARIKSLQLLGARRQMPPEGQAVVGLTRLELMAVFITRADAPDALV